MKTRGIMLILLIVTALIAVGCAPADNEQDSSDQMETAEMSESTSSEDMTEEETTSETMNDTTMAEDDMDGESMTDESDSDGMMAADGELPEMTLDELAMYNGKDGQPVYVAVDGIVYDFSHLGKWKTGTHMGQHEAGQDLSEEILKSPHGKAILERAIPVARLKTEE